MHDRECKGRVENSHISCYFREKAIVFSHELLII